ncbi:hypothetical protein BO82DRAFT_33319 [Aspergillus uvarum CBS 121591]|uniref:Uncharacterized protein n=1 Tax=Aspergillus uvarum CBS 121591 TaxID=1448315 RepID=A0A319CIX6_9EURO|nr:hypothetical protein BO82DRAFT_33319 [Aspergillus uvarum CBS 121591]PYH75358.1 hypothetical protein BO82DRAFT_33319 [Aspergillus uvarum CBS 121591]
MKLEIPNEFVAFLEGAEWEKRGKDTSICVDTNLESELGRLTSTLPGLKGHDLQAWKTTRGARILKTAAYLIPIHIIRGTAQVENGPVLTQGSQPFYFEDEIVVSGSLYYVLALPPEPKSD